MMRSFGEWDSLGYFATRRDKSIVWNTGNGSDSPGRRFLPRDRFGELGQRKSGW